MRVHPLGKERNISRDIRIREKPIAICAIWGRMVRDKVNGRNERSCLGGGQRTEDGKGGGGRATTRLSFRCAETRASDCVASRGGQKRSRLCTRHVFSISLFLSSPYLSRRMINSRAIVPYLEPQLFPRTLQRYRVEALFASIGQKRLIILSTTEFHGSRTGFLSSFPRPPFFNPLRSTRGPLGSNRDDIYLYLISFQNTVS